MQKMNLTDAAEHLGISKEAIHNRIRRGSLKSTLEDGVKFVVLEGENGSPKTNRAQTNKTLTVLDNRYYKFLEEQNITLQAKVDKLEDETKMLRDQKEQMLIQEKIKIEEIYLQKDEQLKNILHSLSGKFIHNAPQEESTKETHVEAEIEVMDTTRYSELVSLKKYLKKNFLKKSEQEKIKEKVKRIAANDHRIVVIGKKFYINFAKYDYSDIF